MRNGKVTKVIYMRRNSFLACLEGTAENKAMAQLVKSLKIFHLYPAVAAKSGFCTMQHSCNISRWSVQSRYCRDSHPDQVCTKRVQPGKPFFYFLSFINSRALSSSLTTEKLRKNWNIYFQSCFLELKQDDYTIL